MKNFDQFTTDELKEELKRREDEIKKQSNSNLHPLTIEFIENIKDAILKYGRYTYLDKGPYEVMNMYSITGKLKNLDVKTVGTILSQCLDSEEIKEYSDSFVSMIIAILYEDGRFDVDALFELDDRF
jgi:predicted transcriptional regulator